jgi:DNA-binding transcriptional regulator YbjK
MPLSPNDQYGLLRDILENHQDDCCGSVSECQQIQRIIQSILGSQSLDDNTQQLLYDIYAYSQTGRNTKNLDEHITNNQQHLTNWINDLNGIM